MIFQLVLKMYVFGRFASMLRKYFSSAFFSKKICIYKLLIFSNLQKRIKKVLFFWSKNFGISKKVRNFASQFSKNTDCKMNIEMLSNGIYRKGAKNARPNTVSQIVFIILIYSRF